MQIGMVGLGRMGANMVRRLMRGGHTAAGFDLTPKAVQDLAKEGATPALSVDELVAALAPPRTVWLMVPAGEPTEKMVATFAERLSPDDVIIDGNHGVSALGPFGLGQESHGAVGTGLGSGEFEIRRHVIDGSHWQSSILFIGWAVSSGRRGRP